MLHWAHGQQVVKCEAQIFTQDNMSEYNSFPSKALVIGFRCLLSSFHREAHHFPTAGSVGV